MGDGLVVVVLDVVVDGDTSGWGYRAEEEVKLTKCERGKR